MDQTASTVVAPSRPLTPQEYVEQLRARRAAERDQSPPQPQEIPAQPLAQAVQPQVAAPTAESIPPQPAAPQQAPDFMTTADELLEPDGEEFFKPQAEEVILEWKAPSRPFKKRDRQYYFTVAAIVFLISLILLFIGQLLPIAVVISIGFLAYVLSAIPPSDSVYKFTSYGVRIDNDLYYWEELGRFWVEQKLRQPVVFIELGRFPGRITLMLNEFTAEEMTELLSEVLLNEKPAPTYLDNAAEWLQKKLPLDKD